MKLIWIIIFSTLPNYLLTQTLQLHYDFRHFIAPKVNARNFPTMYFEYFKSQDTGISIIHPGSFLMKTQADFTGQNYNIGQYYMQVSQSVKFWKPKIYLNLQYSGGLGITEPKQYSYYITNTYSLGFSIPFKFGNTFLSGVLNFKYIPYELPSYDGLLTLYWWKSIWNYKVELPGDFSIWTENINHGDSSTKDLKGKRFYFFAEPQFWYNINRVFAIGSKVLVYFHVLSYDDVLQIYPTVAIRCKI